MKNDQQFDELYSIKESDLDTVLGVDIVFEGDIEMTTPLLVKGKISGTLTSSTEVYISEGASVEAKVSVPHLSVHGHLQGNVTASERVELFQTAVVNSNIHTADLIIQSGSKFNGNCIMGESSQIKKDETKE